MTDSKTDGKEPRARRPRAASDSPPPIGASPALIRIGEAAEMLGVTVDTLRRWEADGRLHTIRSGGRQRQVEAAEVGRLLRGAALAVDARRGHAPRKTGSDPRVARDVATLLPRLRDAAAHHIVDQHGIDVVAVDHRAQHETEQVGGMPPRERTLALPESSTRAVNDYGFTCHNLTR